MQLRFVLSMLAAFAATPALAADPFEKNIMTGGPKGTYIQIGRDIARTVATCGRDLTVVESAGSLENFAGVRNRRNTQFGIVQSDVLEYLKTYEAGDAELQQAVRGVRIMFPLYNEEVHLLAKKEIATARDLAGRKVAVGVLDSGTYLTSTLVLDILRVTSAERLKIATDEGFEKLMAGEIDAVFYVAGAPAKLFDTDRIDPAKFHLLSLNEAPLKATYVASTLPARTYPWQADAVELVAVKAVLMTFDYNIKGNAYQRESCRAVADFASLILGGLDDLKANGHPKWKSVDLTDLPPGWNVGQCVKTGMALAYKPKCEAASQPAAKAADDEYLNLLKQRLKKN